ncbi:MULTISPECIES: stage V sporulation protein AC [Paenibacillus]|uniref:Stage V sporulation protein AC n=1 Tax=Paenibacillus naphthalenovorans TaxID=162209 RepID=A0A0U2W775_9BACL|nr:MULTISPECIES: stage V sporulation protein AC [Paenibacillus]ALS21242.1 stage V sporulation protein AC [Paenibacillus naphthalenovorans]NTZ18591.1 stage V sporulation protein AC [Paenibacillus sp. JMULE4]GCL72500.1 stage V sporulation protein AC [Paenibacillus naphthalenovorans]SDH99185.1 stage V sporulation protein AC [Paenibacillus naphthalenovorans]
MTTKSKMKKLTWTQQEYQELAKKREPARPVLKNCLRAFAVGGFICLIGQGIMEVFIRWFGFTEKTAGNPTAAVLIFISVLLTCFGVYDKIAQWAGAGSAVPVTGFANSICSAALEHKSEGYVLGVGGNMFKLAGSVIVFGTVSAFVIGLIHLILGMEGR